MFRFEDSHLQCSTCGSYLIVAICQDCDGTGKKQTILGERPCAACQGSGVSRQCILGHPQENNRRPPHLAPKLA